MFFEFLVFEQQGSSGVKGRHDVKCRAHGGRGEEEVGDGSGQAHSGEVKW